MHKFIQYKYRFVKLAESPRSSIWIHFGLFARLQRGFSKTNTMRDIFGKTIYFIVGVELESTL